MNDKERAHKVGEALIQFIRKYNLPGEAAMDVKELIMMVVDFGTSIAQEEFLRGSDGEGAAKH